MKFLRTFVVIYGVVGLLTVLQWELFWLEPAVGSGWWDSQWSRGPVTLFFGPIVFVSAPLSLASLLFPFSGDWFAFHTGAGMTIGIVLIAALAVVIDDIVEDIRRLYRAL